MSSRRELIRIEPLGTGIILPAVVLGFDAGPSLNALSDPLPDWFLVLDQQAGGYYMSYPSVCGAVLRLSDNKDRLTEPDTIIAGFQAMAEDPKIEVLRRSYPDLAKLVYTRGDSYDDLDLRRLSQFLARFGAFPAVASGIEALVKFAECDLFNTFGGWKPLLASAPDLTKIYNLSGWPRPWSSKTWVDDSNIAELDLNAGEAFTESDVATLASIAEKVGCTLGAYFLWENSD